MDEAGNKRPQGSEEGPSSLKAIGELLRRAREAKGLALVQAQMDTKIRTKYLEALENGDDAGTPGEAYFKGFLRFYGNYLGLDGTALVGRYKEIKAAQGAPAAIAAETPAVEHATPQLPERPVPPPRDNLSRRESRLSARRNGNRRFPYALVAIILVVAVGFFGWVYARGHRAPASPGGQTGQTAGGGQGGQAGGTGGGQTGGTGAATGNQGGTGQTGQTGGSGETTGAATPGTSGGLTAPDFSKLVVQSTVVDKETTSYVLNVSDLTIDLDAAERCWVRAEADGKLAFEGTIEAGHQMRWTAKSKFVIRFGNPGGVRLKVNAAPVDTGPVEQSPKTYEFQVKG